MKDKSWPDIMLLTCRQLWRKKYMFMRKTRSPLFRLLACILGLFFFLTWITSPDDNMVNIPDMLKLKFPAVDVELKPAQPAPGISSAAVRDQEKINVNDQNLQEIDIEDVIKPAPFCTNDERLELLRSKCKNSVKTFKDLSYKEQIRMLTNIFVDTKHKIMACLPPKSGCTTWKNILANNSRDEPLPKNFKMMKLHYGYLPDYGIKTLFAYNDTMQEHVLKTYTKFLVTRHPLERFRSAYIDKLQSGSDRFMQKEIGGPILDKVRPDLPAKVRASGKGVTIDQFIRYLKETHLFNAHWHPVHELCQPCMIDYDYVLKTETLDHDSEFMIRKYMTPHFRGIGTRGNIVAGGFQWSSLTPLGRELEVFANSSIEDMVYLEQMYKNDLEEFGYSWKYREMNGRYSIRSSCVKGAYGRTCC